MRGSIQGLAAGAALAAALAAAQAGAQPIEFSEKQWNKLNPVYTGNQTDLVTSFNRRAPNFELIVNFSTRTRYRKLAAPVGRIEILMQKPDGRRGVSYCTGTLISPHYILTNHHCIPGKKFRVLRAQIRFGYLTRQTRGRVFPLAIQPVETHRTLDYSIVQVGGKPSAIYGHIKIRANPAQAGEELFIIHHPLGQPKRLTRKDCRASPQNHFRKQMLRHRCDTEGGSSGSLIFSDISLNLVGLHFAGGLNPNNPNSSNHAIRISLLVKHSRILGALAKGRPVPAPGAAPSGSAPPAGTTPAIRPTPGGPAAPGTGSLNARPKDARIARYLIGTWSGRMSNGRVMRMRFLGSGAFLLADVRRKLGVAGRWRVSNGRVVLKASRRCTAQGCQKMPQPRTSWFSFRALNANTMQTKNGVFRRRKVAKTF